MARTDIRYNLARVRDRIASACRQWGRNPEDVKLLAVSKTRPAEMIIDAISAGQRHFGENYLQEAVEKISLVQDQAVHWHFIGAIQSNKTRIIAEHFSWVHTIGNEKIARRLNEQRPPELPALKVMVQVNIDSEDSKAGAPASAVPALIESLLALERLELRGLMTIPSPTAAFETQRQPFNRLKCLAEEMKGKFGGDLPHFSELSMGMSDDLEAAIAEGATWIRVGTAIFGARIRAGDTRK